MTPSANKYFKCHAIIFVNATVVIVQCMNSQNAIIIFQRHVLVCNISIWSVVTMAPNTSHATLNDLYNVTK